MKTIALALTSAVLVAGLLFTPVAAADPPPPVVPIIPITPLSPGYYQPYYQGQTYPTYQQPQYYYPNFQQVQTTPVPEVPIIPIAPLAQYYPTYQQPQYYPTYQPVQTYPTFQQWQTYPYAPQVPIYPTFQQTQSYWWPGSWYAGYARVSLSTIQAPVGGSVTVYANGFPANAYLDFRVGELNQGYSAVYDGRADANGYAVQTITIPYGAVPGEYWNVHVLTTELQNGVEAYSQAIFITN